MKVIVFDLDDTLYSTYKPFELAFKHCFPGYSDMEERLACKEMRRYSESLLDLRTQGLVSPEELYIGRMEAACGTVNRTITPKDALKFQAQYEYEQAHINLLPGMEHVLNIAQSVGLVTILTNGPSEGQRRKLKALHMDRWVIPHNVFISEEIGFCKPQEEIFAFLEDKTGAVPTETLMVGDSFPADIIGGENAGWNTLWFNWQQKNPTENLDFVREAHDVPTVGFEIMQWASTIQYSSLLSVGSGWQR